MGGENGQKGVNGSHFFVCFFILQVAIEFVSFYFSSTTPTKEVLRAKPSKDEPLFSYRRRNCS